jgi:uncharacterized protein YndB with AHSA1/START domain
MARISGHVHIAAARERVFDVVADSRNEPAYNPAMSRVELLGPVPIAEGTRFRAHMGRTGTPMLVELTRVERPHLLASRTGSALMDTTGTLTFVESDGGTTMSWDWQVRPKGWLRVLGPLFGPLGGRMERKIWNGLKGHLEQGGGAVRGSA